MQPTYKSLFDKYQDQSVVRKSRQYARWTLAKLMADPQLAAGSGMAQQLERDYQEMGALLVNNLSSKLAGLLFPASRPFYKIKPSKELKAAVKSKGIKPEVVASAFAQLEAESCQQLFLNASYEQLVLALSHLIVTGNVLLFRDTDNRKTLTYGLQSFAVRRDGRGNVMDCILREFTSFDSLSNEVQMVLATKHRAKYDGEAGTKNNVELFTRIKREQVSGRAMYIVTQQADDVNVGEPSSYPEHICPWQAPTWGLVIGEHYGRGLVEDYAGGFAKLSDSSMASTLYGIEMSRSINLVTPGMGANVDELQRAETGEFVSGQEKSVNAYESGDAKKYEVMEASIETTFGRLSRAFMYKGATRNAERVTAFELKQDALEAEATLGGVYSSLSASIQIPLAHILLLEVDPGALEGLITKDMKLDIMAGIPALGRQADVQNLAQAAQDAAAIVPTLTQISPRFSKDKILGIILNGASTDPTSVYMEEEEWAQVQDAAKQQAQGQEQIANSTTLADQAGQLQNLQG